MTSQFSPNRKSAIQQQEPQVIDLASVQTSKEVTLDSLPPALQQDLRRLIARKVEIRLMQELEVFRAEVRAQVDHERVKHQQDIKKQFKEHGVEVEITVNSSSQYYPWYAGYWHGHQKYAPEGHPYFGRYPYWPGNHFYKDPYYSWNSHHPYYGHPAYSGHYPPYSYPKSYYYPNRPSPSEAEESFMIAAAQGELAKNSQLNPSSKVIAKSPTRKREAVNPDESINKIELIVEEGEDERPQEYVVEPIDARRQAMERRKAYDAHLKTDIMIMGKDGSMNATYNPTWLSQDPYLVPYARYSQNGRSPTRPLGASS